LDFQPPEENQFLLFKLSSLWYFVTAALETNIPSSSKLDWAGAPSGWAELREISGFELEQQRRLDTTLLFPQVRLQYGGVDKGVCSSLLFLVMAAITFSWTRAQRSQILGFQNMA
jgi:hypothetical protein